MCVCVSHSVVSDSASPWIIVHQAPLSLEFSRQEYWSRLLCPPPGDLPDPGIEPTVLMSPTLIGRQVLYHQRNLRSPIDNPAMVNSWLWIM